MHNCTAKSGYSNQQSTPNSLSVPFLIDSDYRNHPSAIFHRTLLLTILNAKVRSRAEVGQKSLLTNLSKNNYSDRRQRVDLPVFTSLRREMSNDPSIMIHLYTNTSLSSTSKNRREQKYVKGSECKERTMRSLFFSKFFSTVHSRYYWPVARG